MKRPQADIWERCSYEGRGLSTPSLYHFLGSYLSWIFDAAVCSDKWKQDDEIHHADCSEAEKCEVKQSLQIEKLFP